METLQLAQMLADLSDLNAAEPEAAAALVSANRAINQAALNQASTTPDHNQPHPPAHSHSSLRLPEQRHHQRVASASAVTSRTASPSGFENFSRRLLTPPMTRSNSAHGSIPGTPRKESETEGDDRTSTMMSLFDLQSRIRQQDSSSIKQAREKIAAMQAKRQSQMMSVEKQQHQQQQQQQPQDPNHPRHPNYTFPRAS